jgi:hypothetical protein
MALAGTRLKEVSLLRGNTLCSSGAALREMPRGCHGELLRVCAWETRTKVDY